MATMLKAAMANVRGRAFNNRNIFILQKAVLVVSKNIGCRYRNPRFYGLV
jgi:IMP cyclohydrolase